MFLSLFTIHNYVVLTDSCSYEIRGSHSGVAEDSSLLLCDAV
jgi:hypothetical protein